MAKDTRRCVPAVCAATCAPAATVTALAAMRRTLADLFGLPASGFTTLADGTIVELHVIPDFVALSRPP